MDKRRMIVGVILAILMLAMIGYVIVNREFIFNNEVVITYPDRCVEKFINGEIVTPECTAGRNLMERQGNGEHIKVPSLINTGAPWGNITIPE